MRTGDYGKYSMTLLSGLFTNTYARWCERIEDNNLLSVMIRGGVGQLDSSRLSIGTGSYWCGRPSALLLLLLVDDV